MNRSNFGFKGWRFSLPPTVSHTVYDSYFTRLSNISSLATDDQVEPQPRRVAQTTGKSITQIPGTSTGFLEKIFLFGNFFFRQSFAYARAVAPVQFRGSAIINCRRNYLAPSITPSLPVRDAYVSTKLHPTEGQSGPGFAWAPGTTLRIAARTTLQSNTAELNE